MVTIIPIILWMEIEINQMADYPDERVCGHNLFLINSKKDPYGRGHANPGIRHLSLPSNMVYDVMTTVLLHWYRRALPQRGQSFLSSSKFCVSRLHINQFHNKLDDLYGLDRARVNTRSTRFSGASALKAAGFSDATIMFMVRWSTLCFLRYISESIKTRHARDAVAEALANRDMLTIRDVRLLSSTSAYLKK